MATRIERLIPFPLSMKQNDRASDTHVALLFVDQLIPNNNSDVE